MNNRFFAYSAGFFLSATLLAQPARGFAGEENVFETGALYTGVNYWASHAGMYMWRNWSAETVEKDLSVLEDAGVVMMRVFPLWPDFQPLTRVIRAHGTSYGVLQADRPLSNPAGVDEEMMRRFRFLCDAAERHGMKLVVGLVTGFMSGRTFLPPALESKDPIADPEAMKWEVRFVRHFVREMKDHPAIVGWDLGNECNVMRKDDDRDRCWLWMHTIASAIRLEDTTRPVVSGMHGCSSIADRRFNLRDQGELMDELTVHPYPLFTPDCSHEPFDTLRNTMHGVVESVYYAGLSGRHCMIEEVGNLSANVISDARTATAVRASLFNAWAHGAGAYLWWCGFDQTHLDFLPYSGSALERGLGLFKIDYTPKPVAKVMKDVRGFLDSLPFARLPPRRIDATVLVSETEDGWSRSLGAFLLAKEAGFDVRFASAERPLPDSKLYILVSGTSDTSYSQRAWLNALEKAKAGATLFVSKGDGFMLSDFREATGTEIEYMFSAPERRTFTLTGDQRHPVTVADGVTTRWTAVSSEVLAADAEGHPVLTAKDFGAGRVIAFNGPLESDAAKSADGFCGANPNPRYLVYREIARRAGISRKVVKEGAPFVSLTEHALDGGRTVAIAVNCDSSPVRAKIAIKGRLGKVWRGKVAPDSLDLPAGDASVFEIEQ